LHAASELQQNQNRDGSESKRHAVRRLSWVRMYFGHL